MSRPLAICQCRRYGAACSTTASQEDLLCDVCREGCSLLSIGPVGGTPEECRPYGHIAPPKPTWSLA